MGKGDYRIARVSGVKPDVHGVVCTVTVKMRPTDARERVSADPPHLAPKLPVELPLGVQHICVVLPIEEQVNPEDLGVNVTNDDVPGDDVPGQAETVEEPTDKLLGFDAAAQQRHEQPPELEDELYSYY